MWHLPTYRVSSNSLQVLIIARKYCHSLFCTSGSNQILGLCTISCLLLQKVTITCGVHGAAGQNAVSRVVPVSESDRAGAITWPGQCPQRWTPSYANRMPLMKRIVICHFVRMVSTSILQLIMQFTSNDSKWNKFEQRLRLPPLHCSRGSSIGVSNPRWGADLLFSIIFAKDYMKMKKWT